MRSCLYTFFLADLLFILSDIDFAKFLDDKTPCLFAKNVEDSQKFLTTSLKLAKTQHTYFSVRHKNQNLNAIASMLFDASSCLMFDFQCLIFEHIAERLAV